MSKSKRIDPFKVSTGHANWKKRKQGAFDVKSSKKLTRKQRRTQPHD